MERSPAQSFQIALALVAAGILISLAGSSFLQSIDRDLLGVNYRLSGGKPIDTSIVILYFDGEDLAALGGVPVKRSYYAYLFQVLRDAGVRAIGFDIALAEEDVDHPEYDRLLASEMGKNDRLVFSTYFRSIDVEGRDTTVGGTSPPESMMYEAAVGERAPIGSQCVLPARSLIDSVRALGHTNILSQGRIPLLIESGNRVCPSLALELLRIAEGVDRSRVVIGDQVVHIQGVDRTIALPLDATGCITVRYMGGVSSLHMVPAVEVMKEAASGKESSELLSSLREKIVLVGIVDPGRGGTIATPFSDQFPSIGLHATLLHNALHNNFLKTSSPLARLFLALVAGILCAVLIAVVPERIGMAVPVVLLALLLATSHVLFAVFDDALGVTPAFLTVVIVGSGMLVVRYRTMHHRMEEVLQEKETILSQLRSREEELRLAEHQEELLRASDREKSALQEKIRRYKDEIEELAAKASDLQRYPEEERGAAQRTFDGIVFHAQSPMSDLMAMVAKVADTDATVLILGESGAGKELIAKALHAHSRRSGSPFLALNCGALSETLLESELFGYERGAFTGAVKDKPGKFELAGAGTIFLDEIGDTSEAFQVKLLRVLQDGTFERIGGVETLHSRARVVAATNRDLKEAVENRRFREDLFYRLNTIMLTVPALRERGRDIPVLTEYFIAQEDPAMGCSAAVMELLERQQWRGNVRELQSVVRRAVLLARADGRDLIRVKDLPVEIAATAQQLGAMEHRVVAAIRAKGFSHNAISETAEELGGLNRGTVAEYFRGYCFRCFIEAEKNVGRAGFAIAGASEGNLRERAERKLAGYLQNAVETVDRAKSLEEVRLVVKPKYKNLPQRYHSYLDQIIESYHRGEWRVDQATGTSVQNDVESA